MAYQMAAKAVTLKVIHRLQAFSFSYAIRRTFVQHFKRFQLTVCSRGPSPLAEVLEGLSPPPARQHSSYGDCLEVKREYYIEQLCAGLCDTMFTVRSSSFRFNRCGFLTLGPLRCAYRRLPRVVLL